MAKKNCFCCDFNPCPCMSLQKGAISAAITLAVLKVISIIVVCVFVVELDQYLKDEKDKHSGGSVSTEPSVEEMYAPVRKPICCFPRSCRPWNRFGYVIVDLGSAKNTWVHIIWTIGTMACLFIYFFLYGFEFFGTTKKQHMFTSYTIGIYIWKWVEYVIIFYCSLVVGEFRRQLLKERQQQTLEASRVYQVQAEAPAQDQPGDQSINAESQIMNP
ncbi:hypothetical protein Ocin01_17928 [Orchesella cincta]|uniref:Uncharacterized protein n=1 Tax=Orchesella cincta TaxID=48709 RepID=A0A1D2M709_ORCCI|nr:hypothetical protein Ocin01_17928 [Orchesella cincta]